MSCSVTSQLTYRLLRRQVKWPGIPFSFWNFPQWSKVVEVLVTQSSPTLCDPMDYSLPGSFIHGILQTRILEWVAFLFSRESSIPRDQTRVSCIAGRFFTIWAIREAKVEVFLEFPWFLYDPENVGNSISGSSASPKPSLYIWKFSIHRLLKTSLKDFEHNLPSMWIEHNCTIV